jgi:hypothetical protein
MAGRDRAAHRVSDPGQEYPTRGVAVFTHLGEREAARPGLAARGFSRIEAL